MVSKKNYYKFDFLCGITKFGKIFKLYISYLNQVLINSGAKFNLNIFHFWWFKNHAV